MKLLRSSLLLATSAAITASAASAVPYQNYVLAPSTRTLRPVAIYKQDGPSSSPDALLDGHKTLDAKLALDAFNASVTYDFGKTIGGFLNLNISSIGNVGVTFSQSSVWVSSWGSDAMNGEGRDAPIVFNATAPGHYTAPSNQERGGFRYLTVVNLGEESVDVADLWIQFTAMPHVAEDALQQYTGWFHSNDEKLNRVWYAGAYTTQLTAIDPTRGFSIAEANSDGTQDWYANLTIVLNNDTSVLVDGALRDRLVWSGDMTISIPSIAVSTYDLASPRAALTSLAAIQGDDGRFPWAGWPYSVVADPSFTYHLHALIGFANLYRLGSDRAYRDGIWSKWKTGMEWAIAQIDDTGLANVTMAADWLRFGMGGHNVEANAILFYTLNLGVELATLQNDSTSATRWAEFSAGIQAAAIPLLWQPDVGLFRDNETTTFAPQDGNAWAVVSGLVTSPASISAISSALQARWGPYGAPAPEAADAISPYITGFELQAHFLANRSESALALIRTMWADYMLDDPRMTNSTFIEGYSTNGDLRYAPYANAARISHAHGWSTAPTGLLTTYVGGIQILSAAGATWAIAPQPGDLQHVDAGFATVLGTFSSKWSVTANTFRLSIVAPAGTTGTVGVPLPSGRTQGKLTVRALSGNGSAALRELERVHTTVQADESGRYWLTDVSGGEYEFVVTGS